MERVARPIVAFSNVQFLGRKVMSDDASQFQQLIDAAILELRKLPKDERDALIVEAVEMLEAGKNKDIGRLLGIYARITYPQRRQRRQRCDPGPR